jgi:hypothetical protein
LLACILYDRKIDLDQLKINLGLEYGFVAVLLL